MPGFDIDAAHGAIQAKAAGLASEARQRGHLDGISGVDAEPFHVRVAAELGDAGSAAFAPLDAEQRRAVASRDEVHRQLAACDATAPVSGWFASLRSLTRWWTRRCIAARARREAERAAEAEALLPLEQKWVDESTAYLIAVYCEAAARGRAAAAVVASRSAPRAVTGLEDAVERALRQQLDRAAGGVS